MTKNQNDKEKKAEEQIAIKVENVSKTFRIPHEKHTSLKAAALNIFEKKTYEEFSALENINFEIKKGEFFGFIGRNGCGKSTLLKILAGIYIPSGGSVEINGKLSPFLELGVGFNPELTGRENIYLGGSILGLSKKEITKKFDRIVGFSEIEEFIDMKMKNYSSGMQVRLAFSLAINVHAEILLMDEVLAVGDSNFQSKCLEEFNRYRSLGKTVILVTHDIGTIQRYCDRAMLLRNGKIVKIGKASEVANLYIEQNMKDEEKREKKKEKKKEDEFWTKKVQITKVELLDSNGVARTTFKAGDKIKIRATLKKTKEVKSPINVGFGLYKDDGSYVFGYNTVMDDFKILDNNAIELEIEKLDLLSGLYFVNAVCFGEIEEKFYDFKDKIVSFRMFPTVKTNKYRGIMNVEHKWVGSKKNK
ncbi:ABC transporter ATP-binding protein [bacterium (Candidatus Howlettbacteria) CG_4_10_14_0_8_um_filter_40_9]|nr:MAG: ABC transporter ATP-binding protein [bacterium (Candidatus Howlettbacteria) CG_4_10_14_0_8_um_filter_40_9]